MKIITKIKIDRLDVHLNIAGSLNHRLLGYIIIQFEYNMMMLLSAKMYIFIIKPSKNI